MFRKPVTMFRLLGFSVRFDWTWLIILALVIWSLSAGVFPYRYPDQASWVYWMMGLAAALGLFAAIILHEFSHSLVARRFGMPIEGITLFVFGGVAEMHDEPPSAKAEFWMAIAGPICSVVLAAVFLALWWLGQSLGWPLTVTEVLRWVGLINIVLAIFNLLPGFPLDGGRILRAALWHFKKDLRRATQIASKVGAALGAGLMGLGFLELILAFNPIGGIWLIVIGLFLRGAAKQGYQQLLMRQALEGEPVRRFMKEDPVTVAPDTSLSELVEDYVYRHHYKMYPVVEGEQLRGCITTRHIQQVPRENWPTTLVREISNGCSSDNVIDPDADAMHAIEKMNRNQLSRLLVAREGRLVGVITLKDLLGFLSLKIELESPAAAPRLAHSLPRE